MNNCAKVCLISLLLFFIFAGLGSRYEFTIFYWLLSISGCVCFGAFLCGIFTDTATNDSVPYGSMKGKKQYKYQFAEYYWKVEHHNQQTEQEKANTSYQYEQLKQDEVKQKPQPKPCYVYLIENPSEHWYKIGISTNIESRFRAIRNALPNAKLITKKKFINTKEAQKIEKMLHTQYVHCNVGLEWFNPTDDELTTIKALLS